MKFSLAFFVLSLALPALSQRESDDNKRKHSNKDPLDKPPAGGNDTPPKKIPSTLIQDCAMANQIWNAMGGERKTFPIDCCDEKGIRCSPTRIIYLNWPGMKFTKPIPDYIDQLSDLEELNLSYNDLKGRIPWAIGNLKKLRILLLDSCKAIGRIPLSMGGMTKLELLSLRNNELDGRVTSTLGDLKNLQSLILSFNKLTGSFPLTFGNLTNLNTLFLNNNALIGPIPSYLGNLTQLSRLDLSNNLFTGYPSNLARFKTTLFPNPRMSDKPYDL